MILENFYKIKSKNISKDQGLLSVDIDINKDHEIFKGHFPDNPVMPGVCMMQIIKEITEDTVGSKLFMEKCSNVKFMALINPEINNTLNIELYIIQENGMVKIKNITRFKDTVALKLSAQYRVGEAFKNVYPSD